ncbi:cytochrome c [Acidocella sp.]|uniref:c-type cytochrome n=1 Tax=Acidocella sp. TaxID=50710 RepID=UPI00262FF777|nr:cytochrome c [Acidocella sp.]
MMRILPTKSSRRFSMALCALTLFLGGALFVRNAAANNDAADYPAASLSAPTDPTALIARGKYLVAAADCAPCHTGPNHAPFTGGLVMQTPFGGLASPNITPDPTTGIGKWTGKQFYDALHYGIAPGHDWLIFPRFLYPAMPYTSYTKLSYADVMAIKAYLDSLAPAPVQPTPSTMRFPFNQRPVLLGWRLLFFHSGPMQMNPAWNDQMKNGAYLTEALGHCQECHTPRNFLSAMIPSKAFAGAPIDAFYAPNISSDKTQGVGGWNPADLVAYLHDEGNLVKGSPYASMGEMTHNSTSQIPVSDDQDIALYLQTATAPQQVTPPAAASDATASIARGATLYASTCSGCHGAQGAGMGPQMVPNLAGNDSVTAAYPDNVIGATLAGLTPWTAIPMPSFAAQLSDQNIADIANYVRTAWGNKGVPNATPDMVAKLRQRAGVAEKAN